MRYAISKGLYDIMDKIAKQDPRTPSNDAYDELELYGVIGGDSPFQKMMCNPFLFVDLLLPNVSWDEGKVKTMMKMLDGSNIYTASPNNVKYLFSYTALAYYLILTRKVNIVFQFEDSEKYHRMLNILDEQLSKILFISGIDMEHMDNFIHAHISKNANYDNDNLLVIGYNVKNINEIPAEVITSQTVVIIDEFINDSTCQQIANYNTTSAKEDKKFIAYTDTIFNMNLDDEYRKKYLKVLFPSFNEKELDALNKVGRGRSPWINSK